MSGWAVMVLLWLSPSGCSMLREMGIVPAKPAAAAPQHEAPADWTGIGVTPGGRTITATTVGNGPQRVYVIGSIHGDEPEALPVAGSLPALLRGLNVAHHATIRVVRDMNPDGTVARTRGNGRGVDLNRNWPASNYRDGGSYGPEALSEIETRHVWADARSFRPDLVVVLHSSHRGPFVNYDGPAAALASAFAGAARQADPRWRVVPSMGYETPGSLGTVFGVDRSIPVLTVELQRGRDPSKNSQAVSRGIAAVVGPALASAMEANAEAQRPAAPKPTKPTRRASGNE
jgi:protein MpaA